MIRAGRRGWRLFLLGMATLGLVVGGAWLIGFLFEPNRLSLADWRLYQRNFVALDGRVVDTGNKGISHSEGQGYGLLIALAYRDRAAFDRIWDWTRTHLQVRPSDKLLSWLWEPDASGSGRVGDPNNASDGDVLVAWALLRAAEVWREPAYRAAALPIIADLERLDVRLTGLGPVLLPGTEGFVKEDGSLVLNPSYFIVPAFESFAQSSPKGPWSDLIRSGLLLIGAARFGKWHLPSDWLLQTPEHLSVAPGFPPLFGYNAIRIPLYFNWGTTRPTLMQPFAEFWAQFPRRAEIPAAVNLRENTFGPDPALPGMRAVISLALAAFRKQTLTVSALPELTREESYYSASLNLLTKVAIRDSLAQK